MTDTSTLILLATGFFIIATVYSSVGFGGGSSYLALLALIIPDFLLIKTAALLCNLMVVAGGSYLFWKQGYFNRKKFLPLAISSVPAAFLGAMIKLTPTSFFIGLGCVLAFSGALLLMQNFIKQNAENGDSYKQFPVSLNILLGTGTGFLSGLVGIGGGIILSPVLNLLKWDGAKKIAALASFFILVNSIAGLLGQAVGGNFKIDSRLIPVLLITVLIGGQLGTRLSLKMIKPTTVRGLTGVLVMYIGIKLVLKYTVKIDI